MEFEIRYVVSRIHDDIFGIWDRQEQDFILWEGVRIEAWKATALVCAARANFVWNKFLGVV